MAIATRSDEPVLLVTGAAGGIGRAVARRALADGARLALLDRAEGVATLRSEAAAARAPGGERPRSLAPDAPELRAESDKAPESDSLLLAADVTDEQAVETAVRAIVARFGRVDGVCHAAGVEGDAKLAHELGGAAWRRVIEINLTGAFLVHAAVVRAMLAQPPSTNGTRGAIVHLSSVLGRVGAPGAAAYAASKHGLLGLVRSSALELARKGIRVNAVCPGFVATPMLERLGVMETVDANGIGALPGAEHVAAVDPAVVARHPMGRIGRPDEVARLALWLLGEDASFLTGEAVAIDGGYLAR